MVRCYQCNKYMGIGIFPKWRTMDGDRYCQDCGPEYYDRRRNDAISKIMGEPPARHIFTISRMWTLNTDGARGKFRLLGATAFLDKGICFISLGSHTKNGSGAAIFGGILGAAVADSANRNDMLRTLEEVCKDRPLTAETLGDRLAESLQVIFYPLADIDKLSHDSKAFGVRVGKKYKRFSWDGGGKTRKKYRPLLDAYIEAIRTQSDPIAACRNVGEAV